MKTKKAFTLVELMVVVGILSIIMLVISQPVASVIKYQRESQTTDSLRDNLQFVINKMEKELKTSSNLYVDDSGSLRFKDQNGEFITYTFDNTNKVIKRNGVNITDSNIFKIEKLNFIITNKTNLSKLVTVSIDAQSLGGDDSVSMQTSVLPVNERPIIKDGLMVHLDAGNSNSYSSTTPTQWKDLSGNNKNLTLSGNPIKSNNDSGYIQFDGFDDYAILSNTGISQGDTYHTIEMWVNIDSSMNASQRWWLAVLGDYNIGSHHWIKGQFGVWGPFAGGNQIFPMNIVTNSWIHLVSTYNGTNLKLYISGSLEDDVISKFGLATDISNNIPLYLAKRWNFSSNEIYFKGKISNFRLYNRALNESEVVYNYNVTKGRFGIQ